MGKRQNTDRSVLMKIINQEYKLLPYTLESTIHAILFFFFNLKVILLIH